MVTKKAAYAYRKQAEDLLKRYGYVPSPDGYWVPASEAPASSSAWAPRKPAAPAEAKGTNARR